MASIKVYIRFVFNNMLKVLAGCIRVVLSIIEAPYRKWFYTHRETRTILFNITMKNHFELFKRIHNQLAQDNRLRVCFTDSFAGRTKWLGFLRQEGVDSSQILSRWQIMLNRPKASRTLR